jgi:predicted ATPase/class 3 adenylate cyclase
VVVGLLPALLTLLPHAQPGRTLSASDTQARQFAAIIDLLRALHQPQSPLLLFLDDMQWADAATLELVEAILRAPDPRNPVLILAWRDDEVTPGHPLHALVNRLGDGAPIRIVLGPLQGRDVACMLADALAMSEPLVRPLAEHLVERAEGNPFAVREILTALADADSLLFDHVQGQWRWSLDAVDQIAAQNGVVALLSRRLDALPPESALLLAQIGCFGQEADIGLLAIALGRPMSDVVRDAAVLGACGLLVPVGDGWEFASGVGLDPTGGPETPQRLVVRFPHDRVQEAARLRLAEAERVPLHLAFAERMWQAGVGECNDHGLFLIAEQILRGSAGLQRIEQRADAAKRLARAALRAREVGAFGTTVTFAEATLALMDATQPQLDVFALHLAAAESAMALGDRVRAEAHVHAGEATAPDVLAQVALDRVRIRGHLARGEHEAAVDLSAASLDRLGLGSPRHPQPYHLAGAFARVMWRMRGTTRESLGRLPLCTDLRVAASLSLMAEALISAYLCEPNLTALWTLELVDRTMRHGITPTSAYAIASYGFLRAAVFGDVAGGAMYTAAAYDVVDRLGATEILNKVELMDWGFVQTRTQELRAGLAVWPRVVRHSLESGDMGYAAQAAVNSPSLAINCGLDVDELERLAQDALALCLRIRQDRSMQWAKLYLQFVDNLRGKSLDPLTLTGEHIVAPVWVQGHLAIGDKAAEVVLDLLTGQLCVWLDEAPAAVAHLARAEKGIAAILGTHLVPNLLGYLALARIAAAREAQAARRHGEARRLLRLARQGLKKLGWWMRPQPVNYVQLRDLIAAELADATGHWQTAAVGYDAAVASATAVDHGFEKALALELAGRAWLRRGHGRAAASYLLDARATWMQHGVVARIERFEVLLRQAQTVGGLVASHTGTLALSTPQSPGLDATAIARATRALSGEIRVDALLIQLLRLAVQTAGATSGALLLVRDGKTTVAARAVDGPGGLDVQSLSAGDADPEELLGPLAAVTTYVQHTRESVLLNAAADDPRFAEVFDRRHGNSILAAPLLRGGELVGIVALKHRDMRGAFNPQRLEMVETLAAQAAVSLVNALLYESLGAALDDQKRLTRAYQRFVPQEFMNQLGKASILDIAMGDQVQGEVTALFADIRGFTALAERLGPQETFAFVNRYLAKMEPAIYGHHGHIAQFLGDAIMAVFPGHADDAVAGAMAIVAALAQFNAESGLAPIRIGIGVNTGTVMVGVIGGRSRMDRGLIGDPVNVASRMEGLCKGYGASLLIGGDTHARLTDRSRYQMRLLDRVIASGKERATDVYEVLDAEPPDRRQAKLAGRDAYERGVAMWQAGAPVEAREAFAQALAACPDDDAARLFVERCEDAALRGVDAGGDGASRLAWK